MVVRSWKNEEIKEEAKAREGKMRGWWRSKGKRTAVGREGEGRAECRKGKTELAEKWMKGRC